MAKDKVRAKGLRVVLYCETHGVTTFKYRKSWNKKYQKDYGRYECIACYSDWSRDYKRKRKILAVEYMGGKCKHCGLSLETHPEIYDFHHIDPSTKLKKPSELLGGKWSKLISELDKCIMLCSNCHRIVHANNV